MKKLIEAFKKFPTLDNATRLVNYDKKHPMATATLSKDDIYVVRKAYSVHLHANSKPFGRPPFSLAGM